MSAGRAARPRSATSRWSSSSATSAIPARLDAAVKGRDRVFHLAGVIQAVDEAAFDTANTRGTANLVGACLRAAPGLKRFVFVSSIAAAGPSGAGRPVVETDVPRPVSAYGRSKLAAETRRPRDGRAASGDHRPAAERPRSRLEGTRRGHRPPPQETGPGDRRRAAPDEPRRRRRPRFRPDPRRGPSPRRRRDLFRHGRRFLRLARDHWPRLAEELGIGRFKLGIPCGAQLLAAGLAEAACRVTGRPPRLTREIVRAGRDHFWFYDGSKIGRELGFRPRYGMRDSVRRAVEPGGVSGRRARGRRSAA